MKFQLLSIFTLGKDTIARQTASYPCRSFLFLKPARLEQTNE